MGWSMNEKESRWKRERLLIVAPVSDGISFTRMGESPFDRLRRRQEDGGAVKTVRSQAEPGNEKPTSPLEELFGRRGWV